MKMRPLDQAFTEKYGAILFNTLFRLFLQCSL